MNYERNTSWHRLVGTENLFKGESPLQDYVDYIFTDGWEANFTAVENPTEAKELISWMLLDFYIDSTFDEAEKISMREWTQRSVEVGMQIESLRNKPKGSPPKHNPEAIAKAIRDCGGNKSKAADLLGISRSSIYNAKKANKS